MQQFSIIYKILKKIMNSNFVKITSKTWFYKLPAARFILKRIKNSEIFATIFNYFKNFEKNYEFQFCLKFYQNF